MTELRFKAPALCDLDDEQRRLYERIVGGPRQNSLFKIREADGSLTGPFGTMLIAPAVGAALNGLGEATRFHSSLEDRLREIAILTVASHRRSSYEWYAHELIARNLGFGDQELGAVRTNDASFWSDPGERVTHELALVLLEHGSPHDELYRRAEEQLGVDGVVELVTLVGYYDTLAMMMRVFGIGVPDGEADPFAKYIHV